MLNAFPLFWFLNSQSSGEFKVVAGVSMSQVAPNTKTLGNNKVVVLHAADGSRKACGILRSAAQGGTVPSTANPIADGLVNGPGKYSKATQEQCSYRHSDSY